MGCKQLKNGNRDEKLVTEVFRKHRFWVHNFAKDSSGAQPVDVIAISGKGSWLVDVKNVRKEDVSFPFSRIEANQLTSMDFAKNWAGIENLGFVICFERSELKPLFLTYDKYLEMSQNGCKSVKMTDLEELESYL